MAVRARRLFFVPFVVAAACLSQGAGAQDLAPLECGPLKLLADNWRAGHADIGGVGPSFGDVRAGTFRLIDEAGKERGTFHYATTLVDIDDAGHTLHVRRVFVTDSGDITASGIARIPSIADLQRQAKPARLTIDGGSGAFRKAHGTVQSGPVRDDGNREFVFDIACD